MGQHRKLLVYAKIPQANVDSEIYFLLRCMVKAGEAENCYTVRSGRPAAWLKGDLESDSAPYSFGTVMEVRALMGPEARKEEARRTEEAQAGRRRRALAREAVRSDLKEAIREMGMMEDIVRDEACEKGIVKGGGIRKRDKADVAGLITAEADEPEEDRAYGEHEEPEEDRAYGEHEPAEVTAAVEPEEDRAHGEHEHEAEAEAVAVAAAVATVVDVDVDVAEATTPCLEQTFQSWQRFQSVKGNLLMTKIRRRRKRSS
jgi:hypothetical protein